MITVGFLINPFAGMGGAIALKGTDGMVEEAASRGAVPVAPRRALEALKSFRHLPLRLLTCSGDMGETSLVDAGFESYTVSYRFSGISTAEDTKNASRTFLSKGVDLIVFCGGDGTARDVLDAVGLDVPIIGIPAGVKMYSGVFAVNPQAVGGIITAFLNFGSIRDAEVMDIDEEAYRRNRLALSLYGYARIPYIPRLTQSAKTIIDTAHEERAKEEIAAFIVDLMRGGVRYILGAGTTLQHIARRLGVEKTLLGVDVVEDGEVIAKDADESTLLHLLEQHTPAKIIVSPIGSQGFVFGRGNQQIGPEVIRRAGIENVIVIASPAKLEGISELYIDTGDQALDRSFGDTIQVICGYSLAQRKPLAH